MSEDDALLRELNEKGFPVPLGRQRLETFVRERGLWRALTRLCVLAEGRAELTFVLHERPPAVAFTVNGAPARAQLQGPADEDALEGLQRLLLALNEALAAQAVPWRAVTHAGTPVEGTRFGYRVLLLPQSLAARAAAVSDAAAPCLPQPPPGEREAPVVPLPALADPEALVPPERRFEADPSYPALLAAYAERLAREAGLEGVRCSPYTSLAEDWVNERAFTLTLEGNGLTETVQISLAPRPEVQPLFDALNRRLKDGTQLVRLTREPWGERVARVDAATAAQLRRSAFLVVADDREQALLLALGKAGFALPYLSAGTPWISVVRPGKSGEPSALARVLARASALAAPRLPLALTLSRRDDGTLEVRCALGRQVLTFSYAAALEERPALGVLASFMRDVNAFLTSADAGERFLVVEVPGQGRRLVLLETAWATATAKLRCALPGCLPPSAAQESPLLDAFPPRAPPEGLPRLRTVAQLCPAEQRVEGDFKCSARPSDLVEVFEQLAAHAGLKLEVGEVTEQEEGHAFRFAVRSKEGKSVGLVRVANEKYPELGEMISFLNQQLAAARAPYRLYRYDEGHFDSGVVRADEALAAALRGCGYLVEAGQ